MFAFDIEVFKHDWLIVFKELKTGEYTIIHNDNYKVKKFMKSNPLLVGFNNKYYDNHIIKAVLAGAENHLIKEINDFIISGNFGWDHWFVQKNNTWITTFDIRDDMQKNLSLKAIEGHLGMDIEESSISFDIDRPLTSEELEETIGYCKYDTDLVEELVKLRKDYLNAKLALGKIKGIPSNRVLYSTNAKLTARFLNARKKEHLDERDYKYPKNIDREVLPEKVFEFFDRMHDEKIEDDDLFSSKVTIPIQNLKCILAFGGAHGAIPNYSEKTSEDRVIRLFDIQSYYPSLMIVNNYISRNIPNPTLFSDIYEERLEAKKTGDRQTSDTYKLVLNTTYGAMLNKYNELFDPLMARSVCISGQLYIITLALYYINECESLKLIQINTDGVLISVDKSELNKVYDINKKWQADTGFVLEEDNIKSIVQSNVNNYVMVMENDYVITKGGFLRYGISPFGAWTINNTFPIVKKATIEYLVNDTPIEDTINNSNDMLDFQIIAKASGKYERVYWEKNNDQVDVQKVNRVYASKNKNYGKLYKIHKITKSAEMIASLPDHCIIDNRNELDIDSVDKEWYINLATERVESFIGRRLNYVDEYVKLIDLKRVTGIGEKTMERIRAECDIYKKEDIVEKKDYSWLDELLKP